MLTFGRTKMKMTTYAPVAMTLIVALFLMIIAIVFFAPFNNSRVDNTPLQSDTIDPKNAFNPRSDNPNR